VSKQSGDVNFAASVNVNGAGDANATAQTTVRALLTALQNPAVRRQIRTIGAVG
jgi:hypothetical protein